MLLLDAIKKMSLQALYLPDRKKILLDGDLPEKKHRWSEAHEVLHSLIPWHEDVMHGDNRHTLTSACQEEVEAEANYGTGRLLFLRDRFTMEVNDLPLSIESILGVKKSFGNTISSTLWRFVETVGATRPMVGMITGHPHASRRSANHDAKNPCRHCIQSAAFATRFSRLTEIEMFSAVSSYCGAQTGGPLGERELILTDDNGDEHEFLFETFFIKYRGALAGEALTLGYFLRPYVRIIAA